MRAVAVFNTYASAYKLRFNNITMRLQNANKLRNRSHSSAQLSGDSFALDSNFYSARRIKRKTQMCDMDL